MDSIKKNYFTFIQQLSKACQDANRNPSDIQLIAVSKKQPIEKIKALYECGQRAFGENQVQEALGKIKQLSELKIEWHFIGRVQSNKTKALAENFSWVQSLASEKHAQRLNDQRPNSLPPLNVCIQLNLSNELSKSGVGLEELLPLADFISQLPRLKLRGVMAIPKKVAGAEQDKQFIEIREAFDSLKGNFPQLDVLSMGMSGDFKRALTSGSMMVRVGAGLFGSRL